MIVVCIQLLLQLIWHMVTILLVTGLFKVTLIAMCIANNKMTFFQSTEMPTEKPVTLLQVSFT